MSICHIIIVKCRSKSKLFLFSIVDENCLNFNCTCFLTSQHRVKVYETDTPRISSTMRLSYALSDSKENLQSAECVMRDNADKERRV
jgi:hypothetical protein